MRELRGVPSDANRELIQRSLRDRFRDEAPVEIVRRPPVIYLGIDPGGGGSGELGIVATTETINEHARKITAVCYFISTFTFVVGDDGDGDGDVGDFVFHYCVVAVCAFVFAHARKYSLPN